MVYAFGHFDMVPDRKAVASVLILRCESLRDNTKSLRRSRTRTALHLSRFCEGYHRGPTHLDWSNPYTPSTNTPVPLRSPTHTWPNDRPASDLFVLLRVECPLLYRLTRTLSNWRSVRLGSTELSLILRYSDVPLTRGTRLALSPQKHIFRTLRER
jgi:hypothetical protein